jgi:hypothetical protein
MTFPIYLNISPDQLASAASFIASEWGDYGYRIEGIESPTHAVSLFHVRYLDGSRFVVAADKWGNCRHAADSPGYESAELTAQLDAVVAEMHANAVAA